MFINRNVLPHLSVVDRLLVQWTGAAHGYATLLQILLGLVDGIGPEMENTRGKHRVGFAFFKGLVQVVQVAGASAGDYWAPASPGR